MLKAKENESITVTISHSKIAIKGILKQQYIWKDFLVIIKESVEIGLVKNYLGGTEHWNDCEL